MSVAFWNARKRQKRNPRLEFQLKDPSTFIFKTRYITDQTPLATYSKLSRCTYEISKDQLSDVLTIAAKAGWEVIPIPDYVEEALKFDLNKPFDESFKDTDIWKKMFDFQKEGLRMVVEKFDGKALICDEMGLGKTLQAIAVCKYYGHKRVLVVCPAYLRYNWSTEIKKWLGEFTNTVMINKGSDEIPDEDGYIITSYELATKKKDDLKRLKYEMAICDESHYLKSHKTKRTKGLTPVLKKMKHVVLLTGTPALNRPCELYSQAHIIRPTFFKTWRIFTKRYCDGQISPIGFYDASGRSNQAELTWLSRKTVMIRRVKRDVLTDLPPKLRTQVYLPTPVAKSRKLKPLFKEWAEINKKIRTMVPCSVEIKKASFRRKCLISKLFMMSAQAKLTAVQHYIKDMVAQDINFIIFAYHMDFMDGICETLDSLDTTYMRIDGSTSLKKRNENVEAFQNKQVKVAVLSIGAASTGLTLTACSTLIFGELYYVPGTILQSEDRIHRVSQKNQCDIRYLIANDTLDQHIFKMLKFKLETLDKMLDGRNDRTLDGEVIDGLEEMDEGV